MCNHCPISKQDRGKRYQNPHLKNTRRSLFEFILWKVGYYDEKKSFVQAPCDFKYPVPQQLFDEGSDYAEWINHSTYLLRFKGVHFLTDPIWSFRCSPFKTFGPKRRHQPATAIQALPKIDFILISHNHYDHLDKRSVLELHKQFPNIVWIVPMGVQPWFENLGIHKVIELDWWQNATLNTDSVESGFRITAVPTQHFSGRSFWDSNKTLWNGYVVEYIEKDQPVKRCYFVGDTGYNSIDFKEIGKNWPHMDLSLIPIGTYVPRLFMSPVHIEPRHAVKIHREVNSRLSLGMHWKTFHLSDEPMHQPPYDLFCALQEEKIPPETFLPIEPGTKINW